ncbi:hypothetical protein AB0G74_16835 [Streptomyces sp. NPDC020875]|uniref:hypothetical protein n=1 Tax=Streptomyces sp. NPDC020875 TaxID=3154898 RepID=UPI0033DD1F55
MTTAPPPPAGDWIRGISIKQPWATAILTGVKTIENRLRHWSWRGWFLLHACLQTDRPALCQPLLARTVRGRELVTGAVIGFARLTGCHQDSPGTTSCSRWAQARDGGWGHALTATASSYSSDNGRPFSGHRADWRCGADFGVRCQPETGRDEEIRE